MAPFARYIFALTICLPAPIMAHAQSLRFATDNQAPLLLAAGEMIWQRKKAQARLSENTSLTQGPLGLSAENLAIKFAADGTPAHIRADGQVVLSSQGDDEIAPRRATAERALVDLAAQTIVLSGNVIMQAEADEAVQLSGAQLALNMASGRARLSGAADKPRARIELR